MGHVLYFSSTANRYRFKGHFETKFKKTKNFTFFHSILNIDFTFKCFLFLLTISTTIKRRRVNFLYQIKFQLFIDV